MDNKKRKILLIVIGVLLVVSIIIGTSFAWWTNQAKQTSTNIINSSCLEVAVEDNQEFGAINLPNAYPLTDLEASKLQPYKFTVRNKCTTNLNYELSLEILDTTNRLDSSFVAMQFNDGTKTLLNAGTAINPTYNNTELNEHSVEAWFLDSGTLAGNGFKEYTIKLWMDEHVDMEDDAMNKTFSSKIIVNSTLNHIPKIITNYTVDGEPTTIIPSKETSTEPTITCNNENVTVTWDSEAWAPILPNPVTEDATCTIAFGSIPPFYNNVSEGDYVAYTPSKTSYDISNESTGINNYSGSDTTLSAIKSAGKQTINPSELNLWRVIKKNSDGTIEIVSEYVGLRTDGKYIYFYGKEGYRRFVGTLNEIASAYETEGITVDSHHMGYDGEQGTCSSYTSCSDQKTSYTTLSEDIRLVNKAYGGSETCTISCTSLKSYKSNATTIATNYWLASRFYNADSFRGRIVNSGGTLYYSTLVGSGDSDASEYNGGVRPVVTLKSGLTATEGSKNGKKMWTIN